MSREEEVRMSDPISEVRAVAATLYDLGKGGPQQDITWPLSRRLTAAADALEAGGYALGVRIGREMAEAAKDKRIAELEQRIARLTECNHRWSFGKPVHCLDCGKRLVTP